MWTNDEEGSQEADTVSGFSIDGSHSGPRNLKYSTEYPFRDTAILCVMVKICNITMHLCSLTNTSLLKIHNVPLPSLTPWNGIVSVL